MNPNSTKNRKLIRQYPFVVQIMRGWLEPYSYWKRSPSEALRVDDLTIQVQKADGDLMFRRANNVGLGDSSCVFQIGEKRKDQVMRRGEYIFAVDADDEIINRVAFPRNEAEPSNGAATGPLNQNGGTPVLGTHAFMIGNNSSLASGFSGYLDDVRVYNRVLSPAEILNMYNATR